MIQEYPSIIDKLIGTRPLNKLCKWLYSALHSLTCTHLSLVFININIQERDNQLAVITGCLLMNEKTLE